MRKALSARVILVTALIHLLYATLEAQQEPPKYEVGVQFSALSFSSNEGIGAGLSIVEFKTRTLPGIGGRFTYNLNSHLALEAEFNLFPGETRPFAPLGSGGHPAQAVFGVKTGKRFEKFGIFAKGRPGFVSMSEGKIPIEFFLQPNPPPISPPRERATHLAFDLGGVFEFYPSRSIMTRFDAGDTIIHYGAQTVPAGGLLIPGNISTVIIPGETRHNFQFSAGVGFRF